MEKNHPPKDNTYHKHHSKKHFKKPKKDYDTPKWDIEKTVRDIELKDTKADLMTILEQVDPDELLMTSLVQQSKLLKISAVKKLDLEDSAIAQDNEITTPKVKIDLSQTCPICDKPIREIMYALHDYEHDHLAHFDCVYKKVLTSVKEKLGTNRYLAYLGSGSFGIMEQNKNKQITLIEKIYPGAPLEEMLHGDSKDNMDEEL